MKKKTTTTQEWGWWISLQLLNKKVVMHHYVLPGSVSFFETLDNRVARSLTDAWERCSVARPTRLSEFHCTATGHFSWGQIVEQAMVKTPILAWAEAGLPGACKTEKQKSGSKKSHNFIVITFKVWGYWFIFYLHFTAFFVAQNEPSVAAHLANLDWGKKRSVPIGPKTAEKERESANPFHPPYQDGAIRESWRSSKKKLTKKRWKSLIRSSLY